MSFVMSVKDRKAFDALVSEMREKYASLEAAVETFNSTKADAFSDLTDAVSTYNDAIQSAYGILEPEIDAANEALVNLMEFANDFVTAKEEEMSDRSEKWQESERGSQTQTYLSAWREFVDGLGESFELAAPDAIELVEVDDLALDETSPADLAEDLPASPDEC